MTLIQLEYVIAVHDHKSFSKASEACFVTQPTLSMQIQKLEDELGIIFFDRKKKPLKTTDIGLAIIDQARNVISSGKAIKEIVADYKKSVSGELKLGIIPTVSPYLLPLFLPKLIKDHPTLRLHIEEKTTDDIIQDLLNDHLDLGILATPLKTPRITEYPLFQEGMFFYVSPQHPLYAEEEISIHQVTSADMWLLNQGHCLRTQVLNLCDHLQGQPANSFAFESGSLETIIKIVDQHNGITVIPETAIYTLSADQKKNVRPMKQDVGKPGREISIVVSRTYLKQRLINSLMDAITQSVPPELLQNRLDLLDISPTN